VADDFDDIHDIENMTDEELEAVVREELEANPDLDVSGLDVTVSDGRVIVSGRLGTDAELQIVENTLTDVLGITNLASDMVVDELRRDEQPEAADEANAAVYASGAGRGGADRTEDSAEHLLQDTAAELYGTDDAAEAAERGYTYNPPDSPTPEGIRGAEDH
jgi:hypothetical protein